MIRFGRNFDILEFEEMPLSFIWLDPGEFEMGIPETLDCYFKQKTMRLKTSISKGLWIGQYPITQVQWQHLKIDLKKWHNPHNLNHPIYGISWIEAMEFCNKLNITYKNYLPIQSTYRTTLGVRL
jgi:formylglycine-generating enzyme required for sulfatase activity